MLRDLPINPPEADEVTYICPDCGAKLYGEDTVYFFNGSVLGCENCIEKGIAYDMED